MQYDSRDIDSLIGQTPLLPIDIGIENTVVLAKMELTSFTGSAKDRMAYHMLTKAEQSGKLKPGGTIIEATTGNTGIAFSALAAMRGYKMIAVMPEGQSIERVKMIKSLGAELVLTPFKEGPAGAIVKRDELVKQIPNSWKPDQFANPDNIEAHKLTTAVELMKETKGDIDYIVHGVGTGGTLMGVGLVFKEHNPNIRMVAVEPAESAVMSGGPAGEHNIQGIGEGFIPPLIDMSKIDDVVAVPTQEAIDTAREFSRTHGILIGFSAGANIAAIKKLSKRDGKRFLTFFCDRGERYLSIE
ncbi:cysteine synthase family protein [Candidatus Woesebacteria bacterium]|nr:cysteine synthase family protein [Candidatus Woesebacteria bacterium]